MALDHEYLLTKSKSFCMYPWVSAHKMPSGHTGPCCVAVGDDSSGYHTVEEISDAPFMREIRKDMLGGKRPEICKVCWNMEDNGTPSARQNANHTQSQYIDVVDNTQPDGSLPDFKYRYMDIRFSNLCNMKCRSCFSGYSSQWEMEDQKYPHPNNPETMIPDYEPSEMLESIIAQIPNIDRAYFAGGEPLITEEHYVILKEFIRQKKTDTLITYNTNISKLHFRNEDLVELWQQFDQHVMVFASLDHYGERAEIIRSGTKWKQVEENYRRLHELWRQGKIFLAITTTITSLNYASLWEFIEYMYENDLVPQDWQVNFALYPSHQCAWTIPNHIKQEAGEKLRETIDLIRLRTGNNHELQAFYDLVDTVNNQDHWEQNAEEFREKMNRLDTIRDENLIQILPEISEMY
jgi:sulfatase maturation enzyme AslB (radical SAM superfamily)